MRPLKPGRGLQGPRLAITPLLLVLAALPADGATYLANGLPASGRALSSACTTVGAPLTFSATSYNCIPVGNPATSTDLEGSIMGAREGDGSEAFFTLSLVDGPAETPAVADGSPGMELEAPPKPNRPVPEPVPFLLIGGGLVAIATGARRLRQEGVRGSRKS